MRRAGIDPGSVRTGVAVADDEVPVATPLCTLHHRGLEDAVAQLAELVARENIAHVVVGLPLQLNGREGESARRARLLSERLRHATGVPVELWDERLSTAAAERALGEARYTHEAAGLSPSSRGRALRSGSRRGGSRARRPPEARGRLDRSAATLILQSYLDAQRDPHWPHDPSRLPHPTHPKGRGPAG